MKQNEIDMKAKMCVSFPDQYTINLYDEQKNRTKTWQFDAVFPPDTGQEVMCKEMGLSTLTMTLTSILSWTLNSLIWRWCSRKQSGSSSPPWMVLMWPSSHMVKRDLAKRGPWWVSQRPLVSHLVPWQPSSN